MMLRLALATLTAVALAACQEVRLPPDCDYDHTIRTYFCKHVRDVFPEMFYGNYHLQCSDCSIPIFSEHTFPYENSLASFNATNSNIVVIARGAFSTLGNAEYIYLQNNKITDISPGAFAGVRGLRELHLENNEIADMVSGFLDQLEVNWIDLSRNRIAAVPAGAFSGALSVLTLNLGHNRLSTITYDSFAGLQDLEILDLSNNTICHLPLGAFRHLGALRRLDLANNKLTAFAVGAFSGVRNLLMLGLANNSISEFDPNILVPFNRLTTLDISNNGIYYLDSHLIHLNVPTLKVLRMDDNLFSCSHLINTVQYLRNANVEIVNNIERYDVQNVNGIACLDMIIKQKVDLQSFLMVARDERKKLKTFC